MTSGIRGRRRDSVDPDSLRVLKNPIVRCGRTGDGKPASSAFPACKDENRALLRMPLKMVNTKVALTEELKSAR
jgi:hypothetical protein